MSTTSWRWSIACVIAARFILSEAGATPVTVGIASPQGQSLQGGAEAAEPMRQSLIGQLKARSIDAVPLNGASGNLDAEAQAKHCRYVLYTHLEKHSNSGMRSKMSALAHAIPLVAFSAKGAASSLGAMALQESVTNAATSGAQQGYGDVRQGDSMTMAYRLVAVGSTNPVNTQSFDSNKAGTDGQDLIGPLVAQVAGAVSTAVQETPAAAAGQTEAPASNSPPTSSPSQGTRSSAFSGLFGHRTASNSKPAAGAAGDGMDCAKLAGMPNAVMSADDCERMKSAQQTYNQAASDPSAARPGDDQMTCTQITAELRQQQYTAPDKTKVAEATATVNEEQAIQRREYANMLKMKAEEQSAVDAASAADNATELATAGMVRGHALDAVQKANDARNKANNERIMQEDLPTAQKLVHQTAGFGTDFSQQLQANPRLARLMQLAQARHCKGSG